MSAATAPGRGWSRWRPPLRWLWPIALLVAVWMPEALHYRIDRSPFNASSMTALIAAPADARLDELATFDLGELDMLGFTSAAAMRAIEEGSIFIEGLTPQRMPLLGQPQDIFVGPPTYQLFMSGLAVERMLAQAHRETGNPRWLDVALSRTRDLAAHELKTRHDRRFLWNDHAVANRASALIALWHAVRADDTLRSAHADWLLSFVLRTGRMLAKPDQFTVRTNHGVMQNLALLQLSAAFPDLSEAAHWRETALARLRLQLAFYVSPEGVVLEHSPGYHAMGSVLLTYAARLVRLNGLPDDPAISQALSRTRSVLAALIRPDGTLPPIGNTDPGFTHLLPTITTGDAAVTWTPPPGADTPATSAIYPAAGWAVLWSGTGGLRDAQLMATWAKHDGHGHKHADEGALTWWSAGQAWLGAVGYWPYGHPLVRESYGWRSSNAPHAPGEETNGPRKADIVAQGAAPGLQVVDLSRTNASGTAFRRQILMLGSIGLAVLDFTEASPEGTQTLWTLGTDLTIDRRLGDATHFLTAPRPDGLRLAASLSGNGPLSTRLVNSAAQPMGGWTTHRRLPKGVDAIEVTSAERSSAVATLFQLTRDAQPASTPVLSKDATPTRWTLSANLAGQRVTISRAGDTVEVRAQDTAPTNTQSLELQSPAVGVASQRAALRSAFDQGVDLYPPWRDLWTYRKNVSWLLAALAVSLEFLWRLHRWRWPVSHARWRGPAQVATAALWAAVTVWTLVAYLAV